MIDFPVSYSDGNKSKSVSKPPENESKSDTVIFIIFVNIKASPEMARLKVRWRRRRGARNQKTKKKEAFGSVV